MRTGEPESDYQQPGQRLLKAQEELEDKGASQTGWGWGPSERRVTVAGTAQPGEHVFTQLHEEDLQEVLTNVMT